MPWGALATIGGSILGGFGKKKEARRERQFQEQSYQRERADAINDQRLSMSRLRESADRANFNPLSVMGSVAAGGFGQVGVSHGGVGSPAPLSSLSILGNAVKGASDLFTDEDSVQNEILKTRLELEKIRLDQLKAGGASGTVNRTNRAAGTASLGVKPVPAANTSDDYHADDDPLAPHRGQDNQKNLSHPMFYTGDNAVLRKLTPNWRYRYLGDQPEGDVGGLIAMGIQTAAQAPFAIGKEVVTAQEARDAAIQKQLKSGKEIADGLDKKYKGKPPETKKSAKGKTEAQRRREEVERQRSNKRFYN